jgi:hypothetical protein
MNVTPILAALSIAAALAGWPAPTTPSAAQDDPRPAATCGEAATSWSTATVGGLTGELTQVEDDVASEEGDPARTRRLAARITFANNADAAVALPTTAFSVVACDGAVYSPVAAPARPSPPAEVGAGERAVGWVTFVLPRPAEPVLIVVRLEQDDICRAWFGFPLRLSIDADDAAGSDDAPAPTATPAVLAPCAGGSATSGAAVGGSATGGAGGSATGGSVRGGDGADAVGGNAVGGDGCPGGDATGADATGGDGGDGGDATADGTGETAVAPDCHEASTR